MTHHATARPDALGRFDDAQSAGAARTGPGRLRRRVVTGTGATLVLAVASVAAAGAAQADEQYVVRSGDTVGHIATRTGSSVAAIARANSLANAAKVRIGQTLTIPTGAAAAAVVVAAAPAAAASHRVASGETVSAIAKRYGTSVTAIVAANGLDARAFIRVGQQLAIPGSASAPVAQLVGNTFAGRTYPAAVVASANINKATLLGVGVPTKAQMQAKVVATARAMGVDPALAQAIAFQESGFKHSAVSPANAIGTMQVIPSSGEWASGLVGRHLNLLDPDDNVAAGVAILARLQRISADLPTAIAGYYQGASSVRRNGMFADTRVYVANIQTHMARFS